MRTAPASTIGDSAGTTGSAAAVRGRFGEAMRRGPRRGGWPAAAAAASIMLRASNCAIGRTSMRGAHAGRRCVEIGGRKVVKKFQKTVSAIA